MVAFLLIAALAAQPVPPSPTPPFTAKFRPFVSAAPPTEVQAMHHAAWRFCMSGRSHLPASACISDQDVRIADIFLYRDQLGGRHSDARYARSVQGACRRSYAENGTGDARILADCLAKGLFATRGLDREAKASAKGGSR